MARDRRSELLKPGAVLNGIDYVEIASADQRTLRVHFLNRVPVTGTIAQVTVTGGDSIPEVRLRPLDDTTDWSFDAAGRPVLALSANAPGDFSTYTLTIVSARLDTPHLNHALFSFKALCPSPLDCRPPDPDCPSTPTDTPAIDYLAKDFLGFRKALSDFSALRYPDWKERAEPDFGMVMMEALSAVADDLSYYQDRVAAEAFLETATEYRSLTRLARLVDYEPAPATAAFTWLRFQMAGAGGLPSGLLVSTATPDSSEIYFEVGQGLADTTTYPADPLWNSLTPYWLDDAERCLPAGSTEMWIEGHGKNLQAGQLLLIETAVSAGDPPLRQLVHLADPPSEEITDQVFAAAITRVIWVPEDALLHDRDLTLTTVSGNIAPATQGRRFTETFAVGKAPAASPLLPVAVSRTGPRAAPIHQFTLAQAPLAWLAASGGVHRPEIQVSEIRPAQAPRQWTWFRWLLDADAADLGYTLDAARFSPIAVNSDRTRQLDYDGSSGDTVRFGDGAFGNVPEDQSLYEVVYRAGAGLSGNVAPDSSWRVESPAPVASVSNPFAATGGADCETNLSIRRSAPEAFRAIQYRAVRNADYQTAAETLPWVQRAGSTSRWTGSWMTVFTTPDPLDSAQLATANRIELLQLLNRYRMAGHESYVPNPRYAPLDLRIAVCARSDSFRGDVHAAVLAAVLAFFDPDHFTFGEPLERSALEAAIQNATGTGGVISIQYRRRAVTPGFINLPQTLPVGLDEIILSGNDPSRPERGSIQITVEGGK